MAEKTRGVAVGNADEGDGKGHENDDENNGGIKAEYPHPDLEGEKEKADGPAKKIHIGGLKDAHELALNIEGFSHANLPYLDLLKRLAWCHALNDL